MQKSKNRARRQAAPARRRRSTAIVIVMTLALLLSAIAVIGQQQQGGGMVQRNERAAERIENAIRAREARFELSTRNRYRSEQNNFDMLGWRHGEEFVSVMIYHYASVAEATGALQSHRDAPVSAPGPITTLTRLGDEAYLRSAGPYSPPGYTQISFRKGNVMVSLSATSPGIAKRFAKYIADAIE